MEKTKQPDATVVERIQKLLALAQSDNEHEAAVALGKAQAMLSEHNLSMAAVQTKTGTKSAYQKQVHDLGSRDNWRRGLLYDLALHNFCTLVLAGGTRVSLIGEEVNMQAVLAMFAFVCPQLERLSATAFRRYQAEGGHVAAQTWRNNFYYGARETIRVRLKEERAAFERSANDCRSLIVVKDTDLREALARFYPTGTKARRTYYRPAPEGYSRGKEAGKQVHFRNEIEA